MDNICELDNENERCPFYGGGGLGSAFICRSWFIDGMKYFQVHFKDPCGGYGYKKHFCFDHFEECSLYNFNDAYINYFLYKTYRISPAVADEQLAEDGFDTEDFE